MDDCIIRNERREEEEDVENLVRDSFWNVYRPGALEHFVLHNMRSLSGFVKALDFVLEKDGELAGQNVFYETALELEKGVLPILTMGPICIRNDLKRRGYGRYLLDYSLSEARRLGYGAVCFEGDIGFYGGSGFRCASEYGIRYNGLGPDDDSSFFLAKELIPGYLEGISGLYRTPDVYLVDESDAEEFDTQFERKEKLVLPSQIFMA